MSYHGLRAYFLENPKALSCLLHVALLIVVTTKIVIYNVEDGIYTRSMNKNWDYYFNPYGWNNPQNNVQLFTVNDTVRALSTMLDTYGNINNISLAEFSYRHSAGGYCQPGPTIIQAETIYWASSNSLRSYNSDLHNTTDLSFITADPEAYFSSLDTLRLTMHLCNTHAVSNPYTFSGLPIKTRCYVWRIEILYRFVSQVYIMVEINDRLDGSCEGTETMDLYDRGNAIWLEVVSIVLSVLYLGAVARDTYAAYRYYKVTLP